MSLFRSTEKKWYIIVIFRNLEPIFVVKDLHSRMKLNIRARQDTPEFLATKQYMLLHWTRYRIGHRLVLKKKFFAQSLLKAHRTAH